MPTKYTCIVNDEEDKALQKLAAVLYEHGIIENPSKYALVKFALAFLMVNLDLALAQGGGKKNE